VVKAQRAASALLVLSLVLSLGVLAPTAAGPVGAAPAEIHVYSGDSIQTAIDDAAPGDIIIVHPGTYEEALTIEKSLTVISSDGAAETIIDWFDYPSTSVTISLLDSETVVFGAAGAGFTVLDADNGIDVTAEYWSSVTIEGNTITNSNYALYVYAVRYFSDLTFTGNTIARAWYSGIYCYSDSVQYHSSVDIIGNTITDCDEFGLYSSAFGDDCHVLVQGNTIDTADYGAVHFEGVFDRSSLDVIDNEISNSGQTCIYVEYLSELSEGRIQGNTMSNNPLCDDGIYVSSGLDDGARLTIEDNTITGNRYYGCYIYEVKNGSHLAVLDNDLSDNDEDGLYIESLYYGCEGVIQGNTITGNGSDGVYVNGDIDYGGLLTIENNAVSGNSDYGFYISGVGYRSHLDILDNEISDNRVGVYINSINSLSECRLENNTISNNGEGEYDDGIYVAYVNYGSRLYLDDNDIQGNGGYGLEIGGGVYNGAVASLTDNDITDNLDSGVYISDVYDGGECLFEGNTVTGNGGSGIYIDTNSDEYGSRFTVLDNTISGNDVHGLYVESLSYGAYLGVMENTIEDNISEGVYVSNLIEGSECIVTDNTIDGNGYGIYVDYVAGGCLLDIEDNTVIGSTSGVGIYCGYKFVDSELKVLGNTISNNAGIGLQMCDWIGSWEDSFADSKATVRCNTISGNSPWGISAFIYRSLVDVSGNSVTGNGSGVGQGGIYVDGDLFQVVGIHQNRITGNTDWGLQNGGSDTLDATENWWGDDSGPYQATTNAGGLGDDVSDYVNYDDWLDSAPALCATYQPESTTPTTITVGDDGEDYSSIQAAIDAAVPGDIILVSPGTYTEDLSIDSSLTVKSTGGAGVTTIQGLVSLDVDYELSTVVFGGVDAGFTVTNNASDGFYADAESWSHVTIKGNIITGCWGHGIGVSNAGVRCFSSLFILDNEITDNEWRGIDIYLVTNFSSADIRRNTISGNAMDGVYVYADGAYSVENHSSAVFVDNEIIGNGGDGVNWGDIANHSSGLVQRNAINGNSGYGVFFDDVYYGSTFDVISNEIQDNGYTGIYGNGVIAGQSHARFGENTITGHTDYGIYMYGGPYDGGRLTVDGSTITNNDSAGFCIESNDVMWGGYLALLDNEISDNGSYGVSVFGFYEGGEGLISGNTISRNGSDGLYIEDGITYGGVLTIQENTIEDNQGYGVNIDALESGSYLALLDNEVNTNLSYGVYLYDCYGGSEGLIEGNTFTGNAGYGLCVSNGVTDGSGMTILNNTFTDSTDNACEVGVVCYGSCLDLLDNVATGGQAAGVDLSGYYEGSRGIISGNSVTGAAGDGVYVAEIDGGCILTVEDNTFSQNGDIGFDCSSGVGYGSCVELLDNVLEDNTSDGVYIYEIIYGAEVVIRGNTVSGNDEGITIEDMYTGGLVTVRDNDISGNDSIGLWLCGVSDTLEDSEAAILGNFITGNLGWGIESNISHAMVNVSACNTIQNNSGGIHLFGSQFQLVHVNNNNIEGNTDWGLFNESFYLLDAVDNWWGDITGPYHATGNPTGLGDNVSDDVTFAPWLTRTCDPSNIAAKFKASTYTARPGESISFTDMSTTGCQIVQWLWDFGDGTTSTQQNPTHAYVKVGRYTVSLTVWDACGYSDTLSRSGYILIATATEKESGRDRGAPEPADLGLSNLLIDPMQVLPNQEVVVSANICNSGEERGTKTVSLMVNGEAVDSKTVGVSGGACQQVTFTVARAVPGTYQVAVDGMTGQFSVLAPRTITNNVPSAQDNGLGTAGILAIIVVMLVLIGALVVVFRRN
jgi:parallel beta-helix repeat protein